MLQPRAAHAAVAGDRGAPGRTRLVTPGTAGCVWREDRWETAGSRLQPRGAYERKCMIDNINDHNMDNDDALVVTTTTMSALLS